MIKLKVARKYIIGILGVNIVYHQDTILEVVAFEKILKAGKYNYSPTPQPYNFLFKGLKQGKVNPIPLPPTGGQ